MIEQARSVVEPSPPAGESPFGLILRLLGGLLAIMLGALSAVLEAFSTSYRVLGSPAIWVIAVAVLGNLFLVWFALGTVGRPWAWWLAGVPWFAVMVIAVGGTSEGDQVASTWIGLVTLAAGTFAFGLPAVLRSGRASARPRPPRLPHP